MPRRMRREQLPPENSWVLEGSDDYDVPDSSSDEILDDERQPSVPTTRTKARREPVIRSNAPEQSLRAEPELVMPSMPASPSKSSKTQAATPVRLRYKRSEVSSKTARPKVTSRYDEKPIAARPHQDDETLSYYAELLWGEVVQPLIRFAYSVYSHIFRIVRPFLAAFAAVWVILYVGRYILTSAIGRTLAPVCSIPGISYLDLPFCALTAPAGPVEFDELMTVQSQFEDVLSSSSGGVGLPLDMKRSESSIRDLKHVVQFSNLPSRNELVFEFGGFIETARQAAGDLTHFNSRVGRAIDHVISTNRWTLQVIDGVADREASKGSVGRFFAETVFFPFQSGQVTESLLLDQYLRHTRAVEDQISELIIEAQALLGILQNLDDRLDVIHSISTRDGMSVKGSRDELFGQLWTKLGGNRASKKKHDEQLYLLQHVSSYRKTAWEHVSGTILKLQSIAAGLEDLRERVAAPDVLGHRDDIPLKLHIDSIQMAVERLDNQRTDARKLESEYQRRAIDKGGQLALP